MRTFTALVVALLGITSVAYAAAPPSCSVSVTPSSIPAGVTTNVTVSWNTTGATAVYSPALGVLGARGSRIVSVPGKATRYEVIGLSGGMLANNTGTYSFCTAGLSTFSKTQPD